MSQNSGFFYRCFRAVCIFLLTHTEIKAYNWLKALFLHESAKKNAPKEPLFRDMQTGYLFPHVHNS